MRKWEGTFQIFLHFFFWEKEELKLDGFSQKLIRQGGPPSARRAKWKFDFFRRRKRFNIGMWETINLFSHHSPSPSPCSCKNRIATLCRLSVPIFPFLFPPQFSGSRRKTKREKKIAAAFLLNGRRKRRGIQKEERRRRRRDCTSIAIPITRLTDRNLRNHFLFFSAGKIRPHARRRRRKRIMQ